MARHNITLIGMPGVGKSTLGRLVARKLLFRFLDIDILIQNAQKSPLQTLINQVGEEGFKAIEEHMILDLKSLELTVISPGGSAVYSDKAMKHLRQISVVLYLRDDLFHIQKRLSNWQTRGIVGLKGRTLEALYEERHPLYQKHCDFEVMMSTHLGDPTLLDAVINGYERFKDQGVPYGKQ